MTPRTTASVGLLALVLTACPIEDPLEPDDEGGGDDTGSDTDSDSSTATDSDTETDGTTETDTGDLPPGSCEGECVIHVDIDAPGGDGSSWAEARNDLRATVEELAGVGGTVWVADGTYTPPDMDVVLRVTPGVEIYGGFAGTESSLDERDIAAHPTVLQQTHPEPAVVEIVDCTLETPPIVVDGFVITGDPNTPTSERGRGIVVDTPVHFQVEQPQVFLRNLEIFGTSSALFVPGDTTVELRDASLHHNHAPEGGAAIEQEDSRVHVHDSQIFANHSDEGAIILHHKYGVLDIGYYGYLVLSNTDVHDNTGRPALIGATVELNGCSFANNVNGTAGIVHSDKLVAEDSEFVGNGGHEGGVNMGRGSLLRCRFVDNHIEGDWGGTVSVGKTLEVVDSSFVGNSAFQGGAIRAGHDSTVHVENSRFVANTAEEGGAFYLSAEIWDGIIYDIADVEISNSEFIGNSSTLDGGAIHGPARVAASSFFGNVAGGSGDAAFSIGSDPQVRSCALWPDDVVGNGEATIDDSCVPAGVPVAGSGNVELFENPFMPADLDQDGVDELYLNPASACVDLSGMVEGLDWTTLTTDASQCTDADSLDAGVHHVPLVDAGSCG